MKNLLLGLIKKKFVLILVIINQLKFNGRLNLIVHNKLHNFSILPFIKADNFQHVFANQIIQSHK